jgi:hypothetical protein
MFDERRAQLERSVQELTGLRQEIALGKNLLFLPNVDRQRGTAAYQVLMEEMPNPVRTYLTDDAALLFWSAYQAALPKILEDAIARGPDTICGEARGHRSRLVELQKNVAAKIRQLDQMIEAGEGKGNGARLNGPRKG